MNQKQQAPKNKLTESQKRDMEKFIAKKEKKFNNRELIKK
jgi:hypothetical protein